MLFLIERLVPERAHRVALRIVFRVRHRWRLWRKTPITGCNIVVTDLTGDILMLRHSYGPPVWGLPGGGVKSGEDPANAARRELIEELGLSGGKLTLVGQASGTVSGSPHTTHLFELTVDQVPKPDRREVIEARFFPLHSLPEPMGPATRRQLEVWREKRKLAG